MAVRISLGQYFAADSPIHRLDPRTKVVAALVIMVSVFFIHGPAQLALGLGLMVLAVALARIPIRRVIESLAPIIVVLVLLGLFNLFLTTSGDTVATLGVLRITTDGVRAALIYSLRLIIGVLAALLMLFSTTPSQLTDTFDARALILLTTTPAQLTDAFDGMLAPLARIGLPAHELAMVFSLMLRFIPTIADEAAALVDAQTARGGALGEGSPLRRAKAVVPLIVSLLASSLHHANDLSRALDARCYEGGATRGHWHPLRMGWQDGVVLALTCVYVSALVAISHFA